MLNEKEEKILSLIRLGGPILPIKVAKNLEIDSYLAGAMLSTLVNNGQLKLSKKKIGSSPLYYLPGQEEKVREIIFRESVNELEKKALARVKEMKVAFDSELYPQERFLLKELSDFVTHMTVNIGNENIGFWKYNSVSDEECNEIVRGKLETYKKKKEQPQLAEPVISQVSQLQTQMLEQQKEVTSQPLFSKESLSEVLPPEKTKNIEEQQSALQQKEQLVISNKKTTLKRKSSEFINRVRSILVDNKIEIIDENSIRNSEHNFSIKLKTPFGNSYFLAKVKDKKISESDLSQFYLECMNQKKPGILFIPNEPGKKIEKYIEKNLGKIISVIVIK